MTNPAMTPHDLVPKEQRLQELAWKRKAERWDQYKNIGDYHGGRYECDFVSPYTKSASNLDSPLMILLQDWASDSCLSRQFQEEMAEVGRDSTRPTNTNLDKLDLVSGSYFSAGAKHSQSRKPQQGLIRLANNVRLVSS